MFLGACLPGTPALLPCSSPICLLLAALPGTHLPQLSRQLGHPLVCKPLVTDDTGPLHRCKILLGVQALDFLGLMPLVPSRGADSICAC